MIKKVNLTHLASTFTGVLVLVVSFNAYTFFATEGCRLIDCGYHIGFPFTIYVGGGTLHSDKLIWTGVAANIAFLFALWGIVAMTARRRHKLR